MTTVSMVNRLLKKALRISVSQVWQFAFCDKVDRLTAFAKGNELQVTDENIEDTILDTAVYAVLGLVEIAYQKQNVKEG